MKIEKNISLKKYTTIRIGGNAKVIYFPENTNDLKKLENIFTKSDTLIIGNGSNIVFKDSGYRNDLICLKRLKKSLSTIGSKNIYASAGTSCARLAKYAHNNHISGFEFLHGIPGTIGGSLKMNAGAFGSEIWDLVEFITVVNSKGKLVKLSKKDFRVSYRKVDMKRHKAFIDVYFKFNKNKKFDKKLLNSFMNKRTSTQPINQWSSGCIFKNPNGKVSASKIIDQAELTVSRVGGIYVSKKHCNYFINDGTGTCKNLEDLIMAIKKDILKQYNIKIEKEVCIY